MAHRTLTRDLAAALPGLRLSDDEADRVAYARDMWPRHHMDVRAGRRAGRPPAGVVWPSSTEEVATLVGWANDHEIPLVPFGAGSGVCGGVLPGSDAVVVDLKRLSRLRSIDGTAPVAVVEAGHMGVPFESALNRAGWTLGHFPSSILCSTVGGWVATRSAGQCSGAYGKIEDMVVGLECVTGAGEIVDLRVREGGPSLVPLVVGSEGTLAIVTCATMRLHPAPSSRAFGAWSFPTTRQGWEAMRAMFQAGLRPAVARLYDPFDAMLARRGGRDAGREARRPSRAPGFGAAVLRTVLRRPAALNDLLHSSLASRALGGALLVLVFEGQGSDDNGALDRAKAIARASRGSWEGPGPAERWFRRRYAVSYRQAPVFANGAFVDTMEVAAPWSKLEGLFEAVHHALTPRTFVMAHLSHAYPDGCCIYFTFAGAAEHASGADWDEACQASYDEAWKAALAAACGAGGTLAHHHGVGRSKAPRLREQLGDAVGVVQAMMRAFDPKGVLNPGNLVDASTSTSTPTPTPTPTPTATATPTLDRESLLVCAEGAMSLAELERRLRADGMTLDATFPTDDMTVGEWLASGTPGARERWLDPVDQVLAGMEATLLDGRVLRIPPAPRRSVGPDLTAMIVGGHGRFGRADRAWLRVHPLGVTRPSCAPLRGAWDSALSSGEARLLESLTRALARTNR